MSDLKRFDLDHWKWRAAYLLESPIKHYKHYSLERLYRGDTFFWGLVPQANDKVVFTFQVNEILFQEKKKVIQVNYKLVVVTF